MYQANASQPLVALLNELDDLGYDFTAITPRSHSRVVERRAGQRATDLRDVFGWSLPFERALLLGPLMDSLQAAGAVEPAAGDLFRSALRVATLDGRPFLHSAFPTIADDSVFFGPDTYRFLRFVEPALPDRAAHLVDLGCGSGAGGIIVAGLIEPERTTLLDINPAALRLAAANAAFAGVEVTTIEGGLSALDGALDGAPDTGPDLIIANPPFIIDPRGRSYRDGGDRLGSGLSLAWAREGMARLAPGGRFLLYTGSAIVAGEDALLSALSEAADEAGCSLSYSELDPDIFGEELDQPGYAAASVERIAAVGAIIQRDD